jgi:putative hemolysin
MTFCPDQYEGSAVAMSQSADYARRQPSSLVVKLAETVEEIEQALRLRYRVFVKEENRANLYNDRGIESDEYDEFCDHLLVKDLEFNKVIATYRLLPGERAVQNIGFYSETEFDLSGFPLDKTRTLELGRSCIEQEYRGGKAIQMLWEGIAGYIGERGHRCLIGCASLPVSGKQEQNKIYSLLKKQNIITERFGVKPLDSRRISDLQEVDISGEEKEIFRRLPPLLKGYQWLGAEIGGDPAYDPLFQTIDFFIVLETARLAKKYRRHFLVP